MDRTGIIVVSICAILFVAWFVEQNKFARQQTEYTRTHPVATPTATTGVLTNVADVSSQLDKAFARATGNYVEPGLIPTNAPENLITITNANAIYTFTSRGGGLQSVSLMKYPDSVPLRWKKEMATNGVATLNAHAPLPVLAILGGASLVGDDNFTLTRTGDGVRAEKVLPDGLVLTKEFHVSSNYLVYASVSLTNTSAKSLALPAQEWVVGTATPMGPDDNGMYLGAMWYNGTNTPTDCTSSYFSKSTTAFFFFPRTPKTIFEAGAGNVVWAAAHNQFFALIAMPKQPAQQIISRPVNLPSLTIDNQIPAAPPVGIQTAFVYPAQTIAANSSVERQITFYAGPKEYRMLALIGEQFNNNADLVMQFGFFGFFAKSLLLAMNWVHDVTRLGYGWVIVLITVLIKTLFWPLTAASTRSMKRMQALAPEVKLLKEKYKDDPQKFTAKQMELWKKNKVSPVSGCLPMLIQTPVFIGFFTMIRSAIELRGAHFLWVTDLSKPDTLFMIPGLDFPFNFLPLLMGASMLWQSHLTPPAPGMDPAQAKMMRYMPLLFLVFLYNYPAGLALYWTVNNLLTVVQTKLTKSNQPLAATVTVSPLTPLSKKKNNPMPAQPKEVLEKILALLDFPATVEEHKIDNDLLLDVKLEDSGRLIGRQGQTLADLQYITNRIVFQQDATSPKVMVDVGGYRLQAREALMKKAQEAADKVRRWGEPVELEALGSFDRRIIHHAFKDDPDVETQSVEVDGTDKKVLLLRPRH